MECKLKLDEMTQDEPPSRRETDDVDRLRLERLAPRICVIKTCRRPVQAAGVLVQVHSEEHTVMCGSVPSWDVHDQHGEDLWVYRELA